MPAGSAEIGWKVSSIRTVDPRNFCGDIEAATELRLHEVRYGRPERTVFPTWVRVVESNRGLRWEREASHQLQLVGSHEVMRRWPIYDLLEEIVRQIGPREGQLSQDAVEEREVRGPLLGQGRAVSKESEREGGLDQLSRAIRVRCFERRAEPEVRLVIPLFVQALFERSVVIFDPLVAIVAGSGHRYNEIRESLQGRNGQPGVRVVEGVFWQRF